MDMNDISSLPRQKNNARVGYAKAEAQSHQDQEAYQPVNCQLLLQNNEQVFTTLEPSWDGSLQSIQVVI